MSQMSLRIDGGGHRALKDELVVASVSGGKDSAAMSLYLKEREIEHRRVFMDTGWEHPLTYEYLRGPLTRALGPIEEICAARPADLNRQLPGPDGEVVDVGYLINDVFHEIRPRERDFVPLDFLTLVRRKGLFPSRVMRFCTTELKVKPIQQYLARLMEESDREVINGVGIRRQESRPREKMTEWEWSESFDCWVWRPIITWTKDDVIAIHKRHDLPMNPLYDMGATRVGCWPCIHARKAELALVAQIDPARIDLLRDTERELNTRGAERDQKMGRAYVPRSMFSYHSKGPHVPITIDEAVEWAQSGRGEWQPPGASDGCARFGVCSVESDEDEAA